MVKIFDEKGVALDTDSRVGSVSHCHQLVLRVILVTHLEPKEDYVAGAYVFSKTAQALFIVTFYTSGPRAEDLARCN